MAEGEREDFRKFFDIGKGGITASFAQAAWGRLAQGKKLLFHDRPGSLEAAIQAAADRGELHSADDVVRFIHDFNYAKAAPGRAAALNESREALRGLPDDAAHALDPGPGQVPDAGLPPGVPPPPPFALPEHLAGKPDAALRAAQDAALAAGLSPQDANAAGRAAAEYVLAHGTSPETVHKRELFRGTEAGLQPDEAGPQPAPFTPPPPVLGPADVAAPGPGGGTPPWWDPALGAVVGAEPESPTPPWWDPLLGQVVEPGAGRRSGVEPEAATPAPAAPGAGQLAEAAALAREAEGEEPPGPAEAPRGEARRGGRDSPFGSDPFSYAGRVLGRTLDELLGPGGDYGAERGGGETAGGGGMMEVLTRIAEGVERLIEVVSESRDTGGGPLGPGSAEPTRDFGYDDDAETPASPSVDLWDLFRPGKARDAAGHPRAEAPKRQRRGEQE